jgi:hypothetical protein
MRRLLAHRDSRVYLTGQTFSIFGDSSLWRDTGQRELRGRCHNKSRLRVMRRVAPKRPEGIARMRKWLRPWIPGIVLLTALTGVTANAAAGASGVSPSVMVCGSGAALARPGTIILTCADDGTLATDLHWRSWGAERAVATGAVSWRECFVRCGRTSKKGSASAEFTLLDPKAFPGKGMLFTRLVMHVTGKTPPGFKRDVAFPEAPIAPMDLPQRGPVGHRAGRAPSGTISYAATEGFWLIAGGPDAASGSYNDAQVAAAISVAESSLLPGVIQQGVDYCGSGSDRAGWGLWQITCGNSVPSEYGSDFQVLDPWNNAEGAVWKCDQDAAAGYNCFSPWSTWLSGAYTQYLQHTSADTSLSDPGEYVQDGSTPPGTPSSPGPDPGSTYGPPMPGSKATAYVFWKSQAPGDDLMEAQGAATQGLGGPFNRGMGPLNSQPAAAVDGHGNTYVYWEGGAPTYDLWEAYWNGSKWVGPYNRGMGPLGSAPSVAVTSSGTAFVFWKGQNGHLYEAQGPANGTLSGPYDRGMGTLGSAPTVGIDSKGSTYVYWEGSGDLWEGFWNGSKFVGPYNRGMGPLGSAPSVAVTGSGTAYVFWKSTGPGYNLMEAQGPANGSLSGPFNRGMGPLNSGPSAGVASDGYTYVYWEGGPTAYDLWEGYWNGSKWAGPYSRDMGPLNSQPTVAIYG